MATMFAMSQNEDIDCVTIRVRRKHERWWYATITHDVEPPPNPAPAEPEPTLIAYGMTQAEAEASAAKMAAKRWPGKPVFTFIVPQEEEEPVV